MVVEYQLRTVLSRTFPAELPVSSAVSNRRDSGRVGVGSLVNMSALSQSF